MNQGESTATNVVLRYLLSLPHPTVPVPPEVRDAAALLADRAHARLHAGVTSAEVRRHLEVSSGGDAPMTEAEAWQVLRTEAGRADDPDAIDIVPEVLWEQAVARVGDDRAARARIDEATRVLWPPRWDSTGDSTGDVTGLGVVP